jgi:hypothetical protein
VILGRAPAGDIAASALPILSSARRRTISGSAGFNAIFASSVSRAKT